MRDTFTKNRKRVTELVSPCTRSEAVAAATAHEFENVTRMIYATSAGNLVLRLMDDRADSTWPVVSGSQLPLRVSHVRDTSTAAVTGAW